MIFVFGSNLRGLHGAGAAKFAHKKHGAVMGKGIGRAGNSYAIPTKDFNIKTLPLEDVMDHVQRFIIHARYSKDTFQVTRIGCGLAGFRDEDIAPLFKGASPNCQFDEAWKPILGDDYKYWGHVD